MNNQAPETQHKQFLTAVIQKYYIVFGPDLTRAKIAKIPGIQISSMGEVQSIHGDAARVVHDTVHEFVQLSEPIVNMTLESILEQFPGYAMPNPSLPVTEPIQP